MQKSGPKAKVMSLLTKPDNTDSIKLIETLRIKLIQHPLYERVASVDCLRIFMEQHAFAVWDFMSLLKRLQQFVTCCDVPWMPASDPSLSRFINEIVLGEESDENGQGGYSSHFELYLDAMEQIGANTHPIRHFVSQVRRRVAVDTALDEAPILPTTRSFVRSTLKLTRTGQPHDVAAAFLHGREDIIPDMFARLVASLPQQGVPVDRLEHYLHRHIELDSSKHGPLAKKLVVVLCDHDRKKEREASISAVESILQRISLWDGILAKIDHQAIG